MSASKPTGYFKYQVTASGNRCMPLNQEGISNTCVAVAQWLKRSASQPTGDFICHCCGGRVVDTYHAEFLKWNNPSDIFGTVHYHFQGYEDENLKLVSQQYRAWSDWTDVQAGLALYWWQGPLTFGVGRIRVKVSASQPKGYFKQQGRGGLVDKSDCLPNPRGISNNREVVTEQ